MSYRFPIEQFPEWIKKTTIEDMAKEFENRPHLESLLNDVTQWYLERLKARMQEEMAKAHTLPDGHSSSLAEKSDSIHKSSPESAQGESK
jgi:hypothetical protein